MSTARFLPALGCAALLTALAVGVASAQSVTAITATTKGLELAFPTAKPGAETGSVAAITATTKALELAFATPKPGAATASVSAIVATTKGLQLAFPTPSPVKK